MPLPEFSAYAPSRLRSRQAVAVDQLVLELEPSEGALDAFARPGQFCRVRVPGPGAPPSSDVLVAHEGIFALLSAPHERALRFLIRAPNPEGGEAADRLAIMPLGGALELTLPAGEGFALERAEGRDLRFVATGTAVAPVRSALEHVLRHRRHYGALSLDLGLRSPAHLAVPGEVARWVDAGVDVRLHYSSPGPGGTLLGVRAQDMAMERPGDLARAAFVAVGQGAMVQDLRDMVAARGGDPSLVLHNY
jgi:NAD(P)H-flavin reductase